MESFHSGPLLWNYMKRNWGRSNCGNKVLSLRLESQAHEGDIHSDNNDLNISSDFEAGDDASVVYCYGYNC